MELSNLFYNSSNRTKVVSSDHIEMKMEDLPKRFTRSLFIPKKKYSFMSREPIGDWLN